MKTRSNKNRSLHFAKKSTLRQALPLAGSSFVFVACLGIWLPTSRAEVIVNLDATGLADGPLNSWTNSGTLAGTFDSTNGAPPVVTTVQNAKGIAFDGTNQFYTGPSAASVARFAPRSIEAWVLNPVIADEETIFAWGRRGGAPDGSNMSFNHGLNAVFGAAGHWTAPFDLGWNGRLATNRWSYVAYTYDGATATVYMDGTRANGRAMALDTWDIDNVNANPLPFRVASQTDANGQATGGLRGSMTIGRIRVHNLALTPSEIQAQFNAEKATFWNDADSDGMPDWYEAGYAFLNPNLSDGAADQDGDTLTNVQEFNAGTRPDLADTDGDTLSDAAEVNRPGGATNPLLADSDNDGLRDDVETGTGVYTSPTNTGTNPNNSDSDGDTFSDQQEIIAGSNPNSAASVPGAERPAIVNLDATTLAPGPLPVWTNNGALGGVFNSSATVANIETVHGVRGVTLNPNPRFTQPNFYTGPAAPASVTTNNSRTIEAWIYNPSAADEETIFSWGRRGGPDGSNVSFNHGVNGAYGAVGHWGAPDIGWNGVANIKQRQWTHVAYTYDKDTQTIRVYSDGVEVNSEIAALNTHAFDNLATPRPLPFRVGSQNEANGNATPTLRGAMTIGEIRVYDRTLDGNAISTNYNAGIAKYGLADSDSDGILDGYERHYAFLNPNSSADAAADQDNDGLTNLQEYTEGTRPDLADTDGDGASDGAEVNRVAGRTNPLRADTDQDGLSDAVETGTGTFVSASNTGTDPLLGDTDADGYVDGQEVNHGSNPTNVGAVPDFLTPVAVVNLDAANLPLGPILNWTNQGTLGGVFNSLSNSTPNVVTTNGIKAVAFTGNPQQFIGPVAPTYLAGNASRTIEGWLFNPAVGGEESVIAWGRRGGPDGSNFAAAHGNNGAGAMQLWGAPDFGWNGNFTAGAWTFVAYTYDAATLTSTVYRNGQQANFETYAAPINTHLLDNSTQTNQLPIRIGAQNNADLTPGGTFATMLMARLRVYDQALSAEAISNRFNAEIAGFTAIRFQSISRSNGMVRMVWNSVPGMNFNLDSTTNIVSPNWTPVSANIQTNEFSEPIGQPYKFYRIRAF